MAMTASDYLRQLQALLPPGVAWPRQPDATLTRFLAGLAEELARVELRGEQLFDEADPRTAAELLADWERVLGLPDPCVVASQSSSERRQAAYAKLTDAGGLSRQFYVDLAARLGYTITVTEFRQFKVGQSVVGDPLYGDDWVYAWQVNAALDTIREFKVGQSAVGDPLRSWGNAALECAINARQPAHTHTIFSYS